MARLASIALGLCAFAAADNPAPAAFQGSWRGQVSQGFGLANASDPNSFECLSSGQTLSTNIAATVTESTLSVDATQAVRSTFNNAVFVMPARDAQQYGWANFIPDNGGASGSMNMQGILMLRPSLNPNFPVCKYARMNGNQVTIVTLAADWQMQCNSATYLAINNLNTPLCETNGQNRSPIRSTVVETYTYQGNRASGAVATGVTAVAALAAAAGFVLAM